MNSEPSGKQERSWDRFTVDANLRDDWLADLNSMRILELRSICEGHVARVDPMSRNAHITAAVRDDLQRFFHRHWDKLQTPISDLLASCFCRDDARVSFKATREIELTPGSDVDAHERLFISATKRHARKRKLIDDETMLWLETTVAAFMAFDGGLRALYESHGGNAPIGRRRIRSRSAVHPE